jgi:hypothetical protein
VTGWRSCCPRYRGSLVMLVTSVCPSRVRDNAADGDLYALVLDLKPIGQAAGSEAFPDLSRDVSKRGVHIVVPLLVLGDPWARWTESGQRHQGTLYAPHGPPNAPAYPSASIAGPCLPLWPQPSQRAHGHRCAVFVLLGLLKYL